MYKHIKQLADQAIELQNKGVMETALRSISALCEPSAVDKAVTSANAKEGDAVQITGIENTETGETKVLSVKVASAKKGGAK